MYKNGKLFLITNDFKADLIELDKKGRAQFNIKDQDNEFKTVTTVFGD